MNFGIKQFGEIAKKLSHNPLGIIALFIVLVYAIAALVMMVSGSTLSPNERLTLLVFLIVFPILILIAFVWLVTRHHGKLYSPMDYHDDASFLKTLDVESQRRRIKREVDDIRENVEAKTDGTDKLAAKKLTKVPSIIGSAHFLLAEELAFRKLESELGVQIQRNTSLQSGKVPIELDGVFFKNERMNIVEIKFVTGPRFRLVRIERFLEKLVSYKIDLKSQMIPVGSFSVLLVVVTEGLRTEVDRENLFHRLKRTSEHYHIPVEIRLFDFDELKKTFGIGN